MNYISTRISLYTHNTYIYKGTLITHWSVIHIFLLTHIHKHTQMHTITNKMEREIEAHHNFLFSGGGGGGGGEKVVGKWTCW